MKEKGHVRPSGQNEPTVARPDPNSLHQRVGVAYAFSHLPESLHPLNLLVPFGSTRTTPGRLRMAPTR